VKILSILPVDFKTADPIIADNKREGETTLSPLSTYVCHSFAVAHRLLQMHPLAYDYIISAYTPDDFLPTRDRLPESRGCYGSSTRHISRLLKANPLARMLLWTGAVAEDIWLPPDLSGRISIIIHGGSAPLIGYYKWYMDKRKEMRDTMAETLSEYCLSLNNEGQIEFQSICRRGVVRMVFRSPTRPRYVRPCLAKRISCWVSGMEEFIQLVSQEDVTALKVKSFLDRNPRFLLGNILRPLRWMVVLKKDGQAPGEEEGDIWLEPAWAPQGWGISDLEAPAIFRSEAPGSERQTFFQLMAMVLSQMLAKQEEFSHPQFLRRMAKAGLAGYSPHVVLVLGTREALELPQTPPERIGMQKAMTYFKLSQMVRKETNWLTRPIALDDSRNDEYVRHRITPAQSTTDGSPTTQRWVRLARRLTVLNHRGIYTRPAALIVKTVQRYCPHHLTRISYNEMSVSGNSIMGLLTLEAIQGKQLLVEVQGLRAAELLDKLTELFNNGFFSGDQMLPVPDAHHEYVPAIEADCSTSDGEDKDAN